MLKLYTAPGTCALASHIALEEAGAGYEVVRLDFAQAQQRSPEYLAVNAKGRVPALVSDQGTLTETPAILAWVAQVFPHLGAAQAVAGKRDSNEGWRHPKGSNVVAWIKRYDLSPIVYLQPGDGPAAYENQSYRRLLANAIAWAASPDAEVWAKHGS